MTPLSRVAAAPVDSPIKRLGRNLGGYFGERIDIASVLGDQLEAARAHHWTIEELPAGPGLSLLTFQRAVGQPRRRLYLSTGIHGDEPAGPLALRELLIANPWPDDAHVCLCPCLNPGGFALGRRENPAGLDLNRDYRHLQSEEVRAHVAWLRRQPAFDLTVCLHEDWEANGFYLYELNPEQRASPAQHVIDQVSRVCPIDHAHEIEGRPAAGGIIRPSLDPNSRPQWPESFFLLQEKTRHSFTLEAPSDYPLPTRVAALAGAVRALLA